MFEELNGYKRLQYMDYYQAYLGYKYAKEIFDTYGIKGIYDRFSKEECPNDLNEFNYIDFYLDEFMIMFTYIPDENDISPHINIYCGDLEDTITITSLNDVRKRLEQTDWFTYHNYSEQEKRLELESINLLIKILLREEDING